MSPTEVFAQHAYSMQAHASLLDRIATLEEALEKAQAQAAAQSPAEEELIALVADLKASRDALHAKASAAEAKVAELERASELIRKRLEGARQDAWAAKDRADVLQLEVDGLKEEVVELQQEKGSWDNERKEWKKTKAGLEARVEEVSAERDQARAALDAAKANLASLTASRRAGGGVSNNMSASSAATTMFEMDPTADDSFESFRMPTTSSSNGALPFKFKDTAEPLLGAVAEEEEDDTTHGITGGQQHTEPNAGLQASFAANFGDAAYSDDDDDDESNGLGSYENEPTGFDGFIQDTLSENDEMMDDFDDDDDDDEVNQTPVAHQAPALEKQQQQQHTRAPSHSRRHSLVPTWRFPVGPLAGANSAPRKQSPSQHADPFLVTEEDEEEDDFDDAPRMPLVTGTGATPRKTSRKSKTRVEVTPQLADSFAMNFAADEDEGFFWGEDPVAEAPAPVPAPVTMVKCESKSIAKTSYTPRSSDPLCPPVPVMEKPLHKLASIVPLVPKDEPAAAAPVASSSTTPVAPPPMGKTSTSKPKPRVIATGRPKVTPAPFIIPPPTFASSASSTSPFIFATSPATPISPTSSSSSPTFSRPPPPSAFPASFLLAASSSSDASSSSSFSSSVGISSASSASGDDSFSYSYFSSTAAGKALQFKPLSPTYTLHPNQDIENHETSAASASSTKNVVDFPTTSASPFAMRVLPASSLPPMPSPSSFGSSLASFISTSMPWSPRAMSPSPQSAAATASRPSSPLSPKSSAATIMAPPTFASVMAEDLQRPSAAPSPVPGPTPSTPSKGPRGQVSADVMRERLRARLVQEGKLKSSSSSASNGSPMRSRS